ncbi:MAG TPA: thioredoxin domain-containing protein [Pyrinomonadaceae bacterium]|jgi:protein-disulfide isomerase|nr:thioredoxin domain-containing protein [Pyrinomonadaceae bacterium]
MKRYLPFIIIAVVLVAGVTAFLVFSKKRNGGDGASAFVAATPQNSSATNTTSAPPEASPTSTVGLTKPNVKISSPVVLDEYGDYQCPPCGILYPMLKQIESEYGSQLKIVFHHFPLAKIHKNAMTAARAAEAARNQGKFWQMHDRLYRNQDAWKDLDDPRPTFIGYARELGMSADRFTRDMDSAEVEQRITSDMEQGAAAGVTGTPTVFIEGHMLRYEATNLDGMRKGINFMLERKAVS